MKKTTRAFFFTKIFHILATLLFTGLFLTSIFITGVNGKDLSDEHIILEYHSLFRLLLITVVFGAVMFLVGGYTIRYVTNMIEISF